MPEFTDSPALDPQGDASRTGFLDLPGCKLPRDRSAPHQGDQRFESCFLQRGVSCEPEFLDQAPTFLISAMSGCTSSAGPSPDCRSARLMRILVDGPKTA